MAIDPKYEQGSILKFENESMDNVIVIGETVNEGKQYILVAPFKEVKDDLIVSDKSSLLLMEVGEDDNISIITDEEILRPIITKIVNKWLFKIYNGDVVQNG